MSAVIHLRRLQAGGAPLPVGGATIRRQRHRDPALNAGRRTGAGRRSRPTSASHCSETTTSSSRNATQSVSAARQPTLRAAAGPLPPLCSTETSAASGRQVERRRASGRSSTTKIGGSAIPVACADRSRLSSSTRRDGRPIVGIDDRPGQPGVRRTVLIRAPRGCGGVRRTARWPAGRPESNRSTPGHPAASRPSVDRRCSGWC